MTTQSYRISCGRWTGLGKWSSSSKRPRNESNQTRESSCQIATITMWHLRTSRTLARFANCSNRPSTPELTSMKRPRHSKNGSGLTRDTRKWMKVAISIQPITSRKLSRSTRTFSCHLSTSVICTLRLESALKSLIISSRTSSSSSKRTRSKTTSSYRTTKIVLAYHASRPISIISE